MDNTGKIICMARFLYFVTYTDWINTQVEFRCCVKSQKTWHFIFCFITLFITRHRN